MSVIIKSNSKNWSGKEFSNNPAKLYEDFDDAVNALNSYHFFRYDRDKNEYVPAVKMQRLEFIHLTDKKRQLLLEQGKVRF